MCEQPITPVVLLPEELRGDSIEKLEPLSRVGVERFEQGGGVQRLRQVAELRWRGRDRYHRSRRAREAPQVLFGCATYGRMGAHCRCAMASCARAIATRCRSQRCSSHRRCTSSRLTCGPPRRYSSAGHRLRIHVTSSDFPRYDRNLNTGGRPGRLPTLVLRPSGDRIAPYSG